MTETSPPTSCEWCGGPKLKARRYCSQSCSDTARQQHGGKHPPKPAVLLIALPVDLPVELPPVLTAEELARAAVFVLTGRIRDVTEAIAKLEATPWPTED